MGRHNRVWPDPKRSKVRSEPLTASTPASHLTLTWRSPARRAPGQEQNTSESHPIIYLLTQAEPLYRWDTVYGLVICRTKASNLMRDPIDCRAVPYERQALLQTEWSRSQKEIAGQGGTVSACPATNCGQQSASAS